MPATDLPPTGAPFDEGSRVLPAVVALLGALVVLATVVFVVLTADDQEDLTVAPPSPPTATEAAPRTGTGPLEEQDPTSLEAAAQALAQPGARVVVLGDSTGDDTGEWVHLWARSLGTERGATLLRWDAFGDAGYVAAQSFGGVGPDVTVRNGSVTGTRASYAMEHLDLLVPDDTDLVLLSYGHNHGPEDVQQVAELVRRVRAGAPEAEVVLVLQNPQLDDAHAEVRQAVEDIAEREQVPTIDVARAFAEAPRPIGELLVDRVHPSAEGSQVWARTVEDALER